MSATAVYEKHSFELARPCRFYLAPPEGPRPSPGLIIALHGYGMDAPTMLGLTARLAGRNRAIVALEAPNAFLLDKDPYNAKTGYNWGTAETGEFHVSWHHSAIRETIARVGPSAGATGENTLLVGFSQPVGLNYRFVSSHPGAVRGVLGICGGLPRNWDDGPDESVPSAILHLGRDQDEYYPQDAALKFEPRLRRRAPDTEFHMLPGPHRFPGKAGPVVHAWLDRVFGWKCSDLSPEL